MNTTTDSHSTYKEAEELVLRTMQVIDEATQVIQAQQRRIEELEELVERLTA